LLVGYDRRLVTLDAEPGLPPLRSAEIRVELADPARSLKQSVPASMPQTVLVVLPDAASTLTVTLGAETQVGMPLTARASMTTRPRERVALSVVLAREVADLSAGDPAPALSLADLAGVRTWRRTATTGAARSSSARKRVASARSRSPSGTWCTNSRYAAMARSRSPRCR
jgi:hypothetical protein